MPLEHFGHHSLVNITRAQLIEKGYRHLQLFFRIRQRALRLIGVKSGAEIRPSCQMPVGAAKPLHERRDGATSETSTSASRSKLISQTCVLTATAGASFA